MHKKKIRLISVHDILIFHECAEAVYGNVTVKKGSFEVNGKSLLGILSLDVASGIEVTYPANALEFEEYISTFEDEKL
jgi:phosphotransferase system HPr-like phosphotransfer protein